MGAPLDLRAGDLIMFADSSNCIGRMIQDIDESPFSHAGLAVGASEVADISVDGSGVTEIGELTSDTSVHHLVTSNVTEATEEQIGLITAEGRRLADLDLDHGHVQLALAGFLLLSRRLPSRVRSVSGPMLWAFGSLVQGMVDDHGTTMVCTDFVHRCFDAGGVDLLPDGLPDRPHGGDPTLDDWLGVAGPSHGVVEPPVELEGQVDPERVIAWTCERTERMRRSGPADLMMRDTEIVDDIRAARIAARHQLSRALGPRPDGLALPDFVSPGDLLRGGAIHERDRWER